MRLGNLFRRLEPQVPPIFKFPWWSSPFVGILLLGATTSAYAYFLPEEQYALWKVDKYFLGEQYSTVLLGLAAFCAGTLAFSFSTLRSRTFRLDLADDNVDSWVLIYRILFALTLFGYAYWVLTAISQGVSFQDLSRVLDREAAAISELKANSRPVAGLTTFTQIGPLVVALGYILRKRGLISNAYLLILPMAAIRTLFYAERLALIELVIPLGLLIMARLNASGRFGKLIAWAPAIGALAAWAIFAASEYFRSWVYYQDRVGVTFGEWVTQRMLGYYATAFNNSALFERHFDVIDGYAYFSFPAFWNAPGLSLAFPYPNVNGLDPEDLWMSTLSTYGSPEFNNYGSFGTTYAELGVAGFIFYWLGLGVLLGAVFARARAGRIPQVVVYAVSYIGLLEVPRFIYWTQGRFSPVLFGFVLMLVGEAMARRKTRLEIPRRRYASVP